VRICPRDGTELNQERWSSNHGPVDVDACSTCRGLFLDDGEIRTLTGNRRLHHILHRRAFMDEESRLVCPNCKKVMEGENVGNVRVDVCLECFGVWLDARELDRLRALDKDQLRYVSPAQIEKLLHSEDPDPKMREAALDHMFTQWLSQNYSASQRLRGV